MSVRVSVYRHPFHRDHDERQETARPVSEYVGSAHPGARWVYILNDQKVEPSVVPVDGDHVIVRAVPAGQDSVEGNAKVGGVGAIGIGVITTVVGIVTLNPAVILWGVGLIAAGGASVYYSEDLGNIVNPADPGTGDSSEYQRLPGIRGSRNDARPGKTVPVVFGKHLITPPFGAEPYSRFIDNDQFLWETFVVGYSPIVISDIKIGDTLVANYDEATAPIVTGTSTGLYTNQVVSESVGVELKEESGFITRSVSAGYDEIELDIVAPAGVFRINDDSELDSLSVEFQIVVETSSSSVVYDNNTVWTGSEKRPIRKTKSISLNSSNAHTIKVRRVTADNDDNKKTDTIQWLGYKTLVNESPYTVEAQNLFTRIDLKIRANDNLSGVVDELNCIAQAQYRDYDGTGTGAGAWTVRSTRNPASAFLYALQGPANKDPVPDSEIDWPSLEAWHEWCDVNGYTFDLVLDRGMPLSRLLTAIAAAGRAEWSVQAGKYRLIQDVPRTTPVQLVTPRNSWEFSGSKVYTGDIDALRAEFVNADVGYQPDERIVYNNGKDALNADESTFETASLTGVTNPSQAHQLGRYLLRANVLRPERFSFRMDVEYLVAERGDLIEIQHDAGLIGIKPARVTAVTDDGTNITSITLDETMPIDSGSSYGMRIRQSDGTLVQVNLVTPAGDSDTFSVSGTTSIAVGEITVGDLGAFGELSVETLEAIVDKVETFEDLTAQISVYNYNADVYDVDSETIPAYTSQITPPSEIASRPPAPTITEIRSDDRAATQNPDGTISAHMSVSVIVDSDAVPITDVEFNWRISGSSSPWGRRILTAESQEITVDNVVAGQVYDIRVRSRRNNSTPSAWAEQQHTILGPDFSIITNINARTRKLVESSKYGLDGGTPADFDPRYTVDGGTPASRDAERVFDSTLGPYPTLEQSIKSFVADEYVDAVTYNTKISDIEDQIDRSITTWYYPGNPTLSNEPAVNWTDDATKDAHLGDLYYNKDDGSAWRFLFDDATDTYLWVENVSPDVQEALDRSQDALDLADDKRRTFVAQPVPPYDIGDMWLQGDSADRVIKRAQIARASGSSYNAGDWVDAANYTAKAEGFTRQWDGGGLDGGTPESRTPGREADGGSPISRNPLRQFSGGLTSLNAQRVVLDVEQTAASVAQSIGYDSADQMYADLKGAPLLDRDNGYLINYRYIDVETLIARGELIVLGSDVSSLTNDADYADTTYADAKASTAETNAESYADGVASTAETNAKNYADTEIGNLGDLALEDKVELAKLGTTVISGGYLKTDLIDVEDLFAKDIVVEPGGQIRAGYAADGTPPGSGNGFYLGADGTFKALSGEFIGGEIDINGTFKVSPSGVITYNSNYLAFGPNADAANRSIALGKDSHSQYNAVAIGEKAQSAFPSFGLKRGLHIHANLASLELWYFPDGTAIASIPSDLWDAGFDGKYSVIGQWTGGLIAEVPVSMFVSSSNGFSNVLFYDEGGSIFLNLDETDFGQIQGDLTVLVVRRYSEVSE